MTATSEHGTGWSDLDAAPALLESVRVEPADLLTSPAKAQVPLIADDLPLVEKGSPPEPGASTARTGPQWSGNGDTGRQRAHRLEISQLAEQVRAAAVQRKNARGGRGAAEHLIGALGACTDRSRRHPDPGREPGRTGSEAAQAPQRPPGPAR